MSKDRYRYIGADPFLVGMTALGRMDGKMFKVQVNKFTHPWSHFWHSTCRRHWARRYR